MPSDMPYICSASMFVGEPDDERESLRVVTSYELEYFMDDGGFVEINRALFPIQKGTIVIGKPGDRRRLVLPCCCLYLHFHCGEGIVQQVLENLPSVTFADDNYFEEAFRSIIHSYLSADLADQVSTIGKLLQLIGRLSKLEPDSVDSDRRENRTVAIAMRYIAFHYHEDISVQSLAKRCNVSTSYLHKLFIRQIGSSPYEAILDHRIKVAKIMLTGKAYTIEQVALRCGFHSLSRFSQCFKQRVGVTPGQFRHDTAYRLQF